MPAALAYVPPTSPERNPFGYELLQERQKRRDKYITALRYFDGNHPEQLTYDAEYEPNDNTMINLVAITAERTATFLFPKVPIIEIDPSSVDETPEELWVRKMLHENGGLQFLVKLALRGFLAGHAYVRVRPGKRVGRRKTNPRLTLLDPLAVTVYWSADDVGEVLWYENRYQVGSQVEIQDYVWRPEKGEAGEWEIYTYRTNGKPQGGLGEISNNPNGSANSGRSDWGDYVSGNSFERISTPDGKEFARHASPIPPIIEFAHLPHPDDYYGHGEANQMTLQDTINRLWSEINRIVRKHSDPVDAVTGADVDEVEVGQDIMTIANPDAKVQRLELKGDLSAAVATVDKLVETYLSVARVVVLKGEAKDLQRVTNASVRTLFIDALAKNEVLRESYGRGIELMCKLAIQMSDEDFAGRALDMDVVCKWPEPLPVDKTEIANINTIGVRDGWQSLRTSATDIGNDWKFERDAIAAETKEKLERQVEEAKVLAEITPPTPAGQPAKPSIVPKPTQKEQLAANAAK